LKRDTINNIPSLVYIFIEGNERKRKREGEEGAPNITRNLFSRVIVPPCSKNDPEEELVVPPAVRVLQHAGDISCFPTASTGSITHSSLFGLVCYKTSTTPICSRKHI